MLSFLPPEITAAGTIMSRRFKLNHYPPSETVGTFFPM